VDASDVASGAPQLPRTTRLSYRRGFATTLALDIVARGFSAISVVVLVRGLDVSAYAFMTLFMTVAQFTSSAATGGVRTMYLRTEAERVSRGSRGSASDFLGACLRAALVLAAFAGVVLAASMFVHFSATASSTTHLVAYSLAFAAGFATVELAIAHHQAHRRFFTAGLLNAGRAAVILAVSIVVTATSSADLLALLFTLGLALLGVVAVVSVLRGAPAPAGHALRPRFSAEELWLSAYFLAAAGFAYVDIVVAGALLDSHEVASLGAGLRYLAVVLGAVPALAAVLRVRTSQVDVVDSLEHQRRMMLAWVKRAAAPVAVTFAAIALLAPVVIPHIDHGRYPASVQVLQIFLVMAFTAYVTAPMASMLMAQRRFRVLAALYGLALAINLAGDLVVAGRYGVVGIAIVSSSTYAVLDTTMSLTAIRGTHRKTHEPTPSCTLST